MSNGKVNIHGKEYLTVAYRVNQFREEHPDWGINTETIFSDQDRVVVKATIYDDKQRQISSGIAEEYRDASRINQTSALENAETSALGRALAFYKYAGSEIASADEVAGAINQQQVRDVEKRSARITQAVLENYESIMAIKESLFNEDYSEAAQLLWELNPEPMATEPVELMQLLFTAPTKGGPFTPSERETIRTQVQPIIKEMKKAEYSKESNNGI